jgi:crossover junction endodeoxyribonuclease RusA
MVHRMIELTLPYPPSANRYYRNVAQRTLISREGRAYRMRVCALLAGCFPQPLSGALEVELHLYPPDRRRRDWDNFQKAVWDSLQHAGAFLDDSQIEKAMVEKHEPDGAPRAEVSLQLRYPG